MTPREKAIELLQHYITLCMRKAGAKPDSDTYMELAEIVDEIVLAAVDETLKRLNAKGGKP